MARASQGICARKQGWQLQLGAGPHASDLQNGGHKAKAKPGFLSVVDS